MKLDTGPTKLDAEAMDALSLVAENGGSMSPANNPMAGFLIRQALVEKRWDGRLYLTDQGRTVLGSIAIPPAQAAKRVALIDILGHRWLDLGPESTLRNLALARACDRTLFTCRKGTTAAPVWHAQPNLSQETINEWAKVEMDTHLFAHVTRWYATRRGAVLVVAGDEVDLDWYESKWPRWGAAPVPGWQLEEVKRGT